MKILILKPSSLGDVVQAIPVLRLLKSRWPDSRIFWWIESALAPLLDHDPDLAGVVRFDRRGWALPPHWPEVWQSVHWMRAQSFDLVIDLQGLLRSGLFAWLANGKFLLGLDEPREGARGFYDLIVRRDSFYTHAVDWYLSVLKPLNVPVHWNFQWLPERTQISSDLKQKWAADSARWIVIQPGARWPNKRWPVENYAALIRRLTAAMPEVRFAIMGSQEDKLLAESLAQAAPQRCLNLAGCVSLPEMIEWIRLSELMISNDTGPMHVAAALGKPVVAVFGPTEPHRTGPYRQLQNVVRLDLPCSPCLKSHCSYFRPLECLKAVAPETVFDYVTKLAAARAA